MASATLEFLGRPALEWSVVDLSVSDHISKLMTITLRCVAPEADGAGPDEAALKALLGHPARLEIGSDPDSDQAGRAFFGVVTQAGLGDHAATAGPVVSLTIRSTACRLKERRTSRVFHDLTVIEIVERLCGEHRVPLRKRLHTEYRKREYSIQYRETDYAFIRRLLAEEGVFFFFDHPRVTGGVDLTGVGERDVMVLGDHNDAYPTLEPVAHLTYRARDEGSALLDDDAQVNTLRLERAKGFTSVAVRRHDFNHPAAQIVGQANVGAGKVAGLVGKHINAGAGKTIGKAATVASGVVGAAVNLGGKIAGLAGAAAEHAFAPGTHYEHLQDYEEGDTDENDSELTMQQLTRGDLMARGTSHCPNLCAGFRFWLEGHPQIGDRFWAVVSVDHRYAALDGVGGSSSAGDRPSSGDGYRNTFTAVPATVSYRPRVAKRKAQQTFETAVVTGIGTDEIHTDRLGRVRVRFHWEADSEAFHSSCWVRVAQSWAGSGFGFQFIPRVGMEVLVGFLGGDVDRPLVVGCLPNAIQVPPFDLPSGTRSGIRSRSVPLGQGHNELSFEDQAGSEEVLLRAQREFRNDVGEDAFVDVGRNRQTSIGEDERLTVGKDATCSVGGDHRMNVAGNHSISAGQAMQVGATFLEEKVTGMVMRESESAFSRIKHDARMTVGGSGSVTVGADEHGGMLDVAIHGTTTVLSDDGLSIHSDKSITLVCGESRLSLTPKGIFVDGQKLQLRAEDRILITTSDAEMHLEPGKVETLAKTIDMESEGASFLLDKDAHLDGAKVRLNCGSAPLDPAAPDEPEEETKPVELEMLAPAGRAHANCRYELVCAGRRFRGTTDGGGNLRESVPAKAEQANLTLWPEGVGKERLTWELKLQAKESASTMKGAQARLQNLGYYEGEIDGEHTRKTEEALVRFQEDRALPSSGMLDGVTAAKLGEECP